MNFEQLMATITSDQTSEEQLAEIINALETERASREQES